MVCASINEPVPEEYPFVLITGVEVRGIGTIELEKVVFREARVIELCERETVHMVEVKERFDHGLKEGQGWAAAQVGRSTKVILSCWNDERGDGDILDEDVIVHEALNINDVLVVLAPTSDDSPLAFSDIVETSVVLGNPPTGLALHFPIFDVED